MPMEWFAWLACGLAHPFLLRQAGRQICLEIVGFVSPPACHNGSKCRSRSPFARNLSTSLREFVGRLRVDSVNAFHLTMRAADKWESARFKAWLWNWRS